MLKLKKSWSLLESKSSFSDFLRHITIAPTITNTMSMLITTAPATPPPIAIAPATPPATPSTVVALEYELESETQIQRSMLEVYHTQIYYRVK